MDVKKRFTPCGGWVSWDEARGLRLAVIKFNKITCELNEGPPTLAKLLVMLDRAMDDIVDVSVTWKRRRKECEDEDISDDTGR